MRRLLLKELTDGGSNCARFFPGFLVGFLRGIFALFGRFENGMVPALQLALQVARYGWIPFGSLGNDHPL
jgi:hypothetical protein